ncbi:unnamed protein product [Nezara viridula]|uniref:Neuropeptide n=1 Tax=Nezara viridula TaxID=85310 RepID=A0A9P0HF50_NEZVI|nr:unnamed protein product [Nezara viridula]
MLATFMFLVAVTQWNSVFSSPAGSEHSLLSATKPFEQSIFRNKIRCSPDTCCPLNTKCSRGGYWCNNGASWSRAEKC